MSLSPPPPHSKRSPISLAGVRPVEDERFKGQAWPAYLSRRIREALPVFRQLLSANAAMMIRNGMLLTTWALATATATRMGTLDVAGHQVRCMILVVEDELSWGEGLQVASKGLTSPGLVWLAGGAVPVAVLCLGRRGSGDRRTGETTCSVAVHTYALEAVCSPRNL